MASALDKVCEICGSSFTTNRKEKKYCGKECYKQNNKRIKEENRKRYNQTYYEKHKESIRARCKEDYAENKELYQEKAKQSYQKHKEKRIKSYLRWVKEKRKTDEVFRITCNIRTRLWHALRNQQADKPCASLDLLGCSVSEYREYIEGLFTEGMTWENYGLHGWHIDHRRPIASFNLLDEEEVKKAFHYTNTQPMWAEENLRKGDKTEWHQR